MDEYEPESGDSSNDSDGNDMDFVPQTPRAPDPQTSISTQSHSMRGRYRRRGAARCRGGGSQSIYSTCQ